MPATSQIKTYLIKQPLLSELLALTPAFTLISVSKCWKKADDQVLLVDDSKLQSSCDKNLIHLALDRLVQETEQGVSDNNKQLSKLLKAYLVPPRFGDTIGEMGNIFLSTAAIYLIPLIACSLCLLLCVWPVTIAAIPTVIACFLLLQVSSIAIICVGLAYTVGNERGNMAAKHQQDTDNLSKELGLHLQSQGEKKSSMAELVFLNQQTRCKGEPAAVLRSGYQWVGEQTFLGTSESGNKWRPAQPPLGLCNTDRSGGLSFFPMSDTVMPVVPCVPGMERTDPVSEDYHNRTAPSSFGMTALLRMAH